MGCSASSAADPVSLPSLCTQFGGTVGADEFCQVRDNTATYRLTLQFPVDYPDQAAVADYLSQRRDEFIGAAAAASRPVELGVVGQVYRSGDRQSGTQSLVLTIDDDTGSRPQTTVRTFSYSLADRAPITLATLFTAGSDPSSILNPIVAQILSSADPAASRRAEGLTATAYQQFAITDTEVVFYFNPDGPLAPDAGPLEIPVPRGRLAPILR